MSNYTPLSALEPTPPTTVPSAPVPRVPQAQPQLPPRNLPYQAAAAATAAGGAGGGDTEFIDDIIAELNGTAPADDQGQTEAATDTTSLAAFTPKTATSAPSPSQGDDGSPGGDVLDKGDDGGASDYADTSDGTGRGLSMYDGEFWQILARGLRDPLVVGVVVAFVSSPRIQRRIGEFAPLFVGDSVQATLLRAFAAMVVYVIVCRII